MNFIKDIINFILPPRCYICGKVLNEDKAVCDDCISKIEFLKATNKGSNIKLTKF